MTVAVPQAGERPVPWLRGLRVYVATMAGGSLVWESLHLPLYSIWRTGSAAEQAFAAIHCTLGDVLIALSALMLALIAAGNDGWPVRRFWSVAFITIVSGLGYTVFSEWRNVVVRASWAYSDWMPVVPLFGLRIGLSPLLQWIVLPATAFAITRGATIERNGVRS
jgi:hypothetical protein